MTTATPIRKEQRTIKQDRDRLAGFSYVDNRDGRRKFYRLAKALKRRMDRREASLSDIERVRRRQAHIQIEQEREARNAERASRAVSS